MFKKGIYTNILFMIVSMMACNTKQLAHQFGLVPLPKSIELSNKKSKVTNQWYIKHNGGHDDLEILSAELSSRLKSEFNLSLSNQGDKSISLNVASDVTDIGSEGYEMNISDDGISIYASTPNGVFYGIQTLYQLFDSDTNYENGVELSHLTILDEPRFKWRGMHLDVGRHFFEVDFIKKYIDYLALHKMNIFHWHLTRQKG